MSDGQGDWKAERLATQRQGVANKLGQEALERVDSATYQITDVLMMRLQMLKLEGENPEPFLEAIWEFSQALAKRLGSANMRPDSALTALAGATALMVPEPMPQYAEDAKRMVKALTNRYGSLTE